MDNVRKVMVGMCVVMMMVWLCVSCGDTDKPSEEVIKKTIIDIDSRSRGTPGISLLEAQRYWCYPDNYEVKNLIITNSFFQLTKGINTYCIEVDYDLQFRLNFSINGEKRVDNGNVPHKGQQYSFVKKGNKWYGKGGWKN